MENPRPEKVAVVEEVRERLDSTSAALLTEYRGLDVTAISDLRRALRQVGGERMVDDGQGHGRILTEPRLVTLGSGVAG